MTTGEKIAVQRRRAGLSQEALAERLGISRQAISRWETNESLPDTERIIQLSRIFEVSTDYLLLDKPTEASTTNSEPTAAPTESASLSLLETTVIRWFRLGGLCLTGGGAVLMLTGLIYSVFLSVQITNATLGWVLRNCSSGAWLMVGVLLILAGLLLLAANSFLHKRP